LGEKGRKRNESATFIRGRKEEDCLEKAAWGRGRGGDLRKNHREKGNPLQQHGKKKKKKRKGTSRGGTVIK